MTTVWLVWRSDSHGKYLEAVCGTEQARDAQIDAVCHILTVYHGAFYPVHFDQKIDSSEIITQYGERIFWTQELVI